MKQQAENMVEEEMSPERVVGPDSERILGKLSGLWKAEAKKAAVEKELSLLYLEGPSGLSLCLTSKPPKCVRCPEWTELVRSETLPPPPQAQTFWGF